MSQQKSPHEEFILAGIVLFLVIGIAWVIWTVFKVELTNALRWVRLGEMYIAGMITDDQYHINHPQAGPQYLEKWKEWLPHADPRNISTEYIKVMTSLTMQPLKIVFAGLFGLMALWAIFKGPGNHFRRKMSLDTLMAEQAKMFPVVHPFIEFNPNKLKGRAPGDPIPAKLPLFSEALAPEEWVAYHDIAFKEGKLEYAKTYRALAKQLGPRWQGPEKAPIHVRGLYAAFALKSVRKRKESDHLLEEMAMSWSGKSGFKPSVQLRHKINKIIKDQKICGDLNKVTRRHAYQATALLRALQRSREEGGVLAPAQFLWLRGHDRLLWYPLHNLGRKSYHAEAAGALSHFTNELIAEQKIPSPRYDEVIKVIEDILTGPDARPVPKHLPK